MGTDLRPCMPCNHLTGVCCGTEAVSYLRRIDSCITQLKVQGASQTCTERKEEKKKMNPEV